MSSTGGGKEFDFIVVGGGNAGALVAGNLAKSKSRSSILLIERGGENKNPNFLLASERYTNVFKHDEVRLGYKTVPQKHLNGRSLDMIRGQGLGGTSMANFCGYFRGSRSDYDTWADIVGDDTFRWRNVVRRFIELEKLHFNDDHDPDGYVKLRDGVHGFDGPVDIYLHSRREWPPGLDKLMQGCIEHGWPLNPDQNSGDLIGVGAISVTIHNGLRVTSATAYLNDPPPNLTIWTHALASKLLFAPYSPGQKPRAIGVELANGRKALARRSVILSAGTIDTPKLLLLSGIGPKDELRHLGIPSVVDLPRLGKDMVDHVFVMLPWELAPGVAKEEVIAPELEVLAPQGDSDKASREQLEEELGAYHEWMGASNLIAFVKYDAERSPQYFQALEELDDTTKKWLSHPQTPHFEVFLQGAGAPTSTAQQELSAFATGVMAMNPQSRGTVTLASKDPTEAPLIDPKYLEHPYDTRLLIEGVKECHHLIENTSLRNYKPGVEFGSEAHIIAHVKENLASISHPVGTVRMGHKDDPTACVDTDFRLRGVDNVRVIDLSVCPIITSNHTQATVYVVGQLGWRRLVQDYELDLAPPPPKL